MVYGPSKIEDKKDVCRACALGKIHRESFSKEKTWRAKTSLELIHTDIYGPMSINSHGDNSYFIFFIDNFFRMCWMYFLRQNQKKKLVFRKFQKWLKDKVVV
jgi:hypothetical protein